MGWWNLSRNNTSAAIWPQSSLHTKLHLLSAAFTKLVFPRCRFLYSLGLKKWKISQTNSSLCWLTCACADCSADFNICPLNLTKAKTDLCDNPVIITSCDCDWCKSRSIYPVFSCCFLFQGKFPEAEVEFIKAGKPKEAVFMWVQDVKTHVRISGIFTVYSFVDVPGWESSWRLFLFLSLICL